MVSPNPSETPGGAASASGTPRSINDVVIRLAGDSQDGIQTVGGFLARLAGRSDQDVMTYMTIPSTISGGPSIFQVRMGTGDILSSGDRADMLVAFYQHSYEAHIGSLRPGGVLLYDSDHVKPNAEDNRFTNIAVPITSATVESVGGAGKDKGKNIFILGLLARIFDLDVVKLTALVKERFGGKSEDVVRNAMLAFDAGYAWPQNNLRDIFYRFEAVDKAAASGKPQVTMDGNMALAYGLLAGGVRHGAGYPITPWSSIMEMLRVELPKYGGIFVQCEDEIASISTALGFSYTGHLAVTGSSGPGLSLKMEALGWATMAEMPLIVVNVQRGGPSTGMPTNVRAKRSHAGHLRQPTAIRRASYSRRKTSRTVSTLASRLRASPASTAPPSSSSPTRASPRASRRSTNPTSRNSWSNRSPTSPRAAPITNPTRSIASPTMRTPARASTPANTRPSPGSSTTKWVIRPAAPRCT